MWKLITILALLTSLWAWSATGSEGVSQDLQEPIRFTADNEFLDMREGTFRATGDVEIEQGSLRILADELEVMGFSAETSEADIFIARGEPARYRQLIQPGREVRATALIIEYNASERTLTLRGNATLEQDRNSVQAALIRYDLEAQQVSAERGENERVTTIFYPGEQTERNNDNETNGN